MTDQLKYWDTGHYRTVASNLTPAIREYQEAEEELIRRVIMPGSDILEVGCGTGRILNLIKDDARLIIGIDHSVQMLKDAEAAANDEKVILVKGDALQVPFYDNSFDYALCLFNTFGNFTGNLERYLGEMRRVVRKDGQILVSVYSENATQAQIEFYKNVGLTVDEIKEDRIVLSEGFSSYRFTKEELIRLFSHQELDTQITKLTSISYSAIGNKRPS